MGALVIAVYSTPVNLHRILNFLFGNWKYKCSIYEHGIHVSYLRNQCCGSGSGIRCIIDPWIRDLGWLKSQDPDRDPGWTTRIIFPRALNPFFWVKILKFFDADPGSGMEKIRIWDGKKSDPGIRDREKHPGSATLFVTVYPRPPTILLCTVLLERAALPENMARALYHLITGKQDTLFLRETG